MTPLRQNKFPIAAIGFALIALFEIPNIGHAFHMLSRLDTVEFGMAINFAAYAIFYMIRPFAAAVLSGLLFMRKNNSSLTMAIGAWTGSHLLYWFCYPYSSLSLYFWVTLLCYAGLIVICLSAQNKLFPKTLQTAFFVLFLILNALVFFLNFYSLYKDYGLFYGATTNRIIYSLRSSIPTLFSCITMLLLALWLRQCAKQNDSASETK